MSIYDGFKTDKWLQQLATEPIEDGGKVLNENVTAVEDSLGPSVFALVDPTVNDDITKDFFQWSKWVNTDTLCVFVCSDNTAGSAVWIKSSETDIPGADTQVIFNKEGRLSGSNELTFDGITLTIVGIGGNPLVLRRYDDNDHDIVLASGETVNKATRLEWQDKDGNTIWQFGKDGAGALVEQAVSTQAGLPIAINTRYISTLLGTHHINSIKTAAVEINGSLDTNAGWGGFAIKSGDAESGYGFDPGLNGSALFDFHYDANSVYQDIHALENTQALYRRYYGTNGPSELWMWERVTESGLLLYDEVQATNIYAYDSAAKEWAFYVDVVYHAGLIADGGIYLKDDVQLVLGTDLDVSFMYTSADELILTKAAGRPFYIDQPDDVEGLRIRRILTGGGQIHLFNTATGDQVIEASNALSITAANTITLDAVGGAIRAFPNTTETPELQLYGVNASAGVHHTAFRTNTQGALEIVSPSGAVRLPSYSGGYYSGTSDEMKLGHNGARTNFESGGGLYISGGQVGIGATPATFAELYVRAFTNWGVYGRSDSSVGVRGTSVDSVGVDGASTNSIGVIGSGAVYGVYGTGTGGGAGIHARSTTSRAILAYKADASAVAAMEIDAQDAANTGAVVLANQAGTGPLFEFKAKDILKVSADNDGVVYAEDYQYNTAKAETIALSPAPTPGGKDSAEPEEIVEGVIGFKYVKNADAGMWFYANVDSNTFDTSSVLSLSISWTYSGTTANTVEWGAIGDVFVEGDALSTGEAYLSGPVNAQESTVELTTIAIPLAGFVGLGQVSFKLFRNRSGANDTLNADVHVLGFYATIDKKGPK